MNPFNPPLAEGIRRFGFRKWYERELLSSHAHMLLALLSTIALLASFEGFHDASVNEKLLNTLFVILCAGITFWALRRYVYLLMHAEELANQANCPQCQRYGLLRVSEQQPERTRLRVCCKKCDAEWGISP